MDIYLNKTTDELFLVSDNKGLLVKFNSKNNLQSLFEAELSETEASACESEVFFRILKLKEKK